MLEYTWIFGENLGKTSNNNSFYFWKEINTEKDGIKKFFVMEKNKSNKKIYKSLSRQEKKHILWKNTFKHWRFYKKSDMCFVTLSYKDVQPNRLFRKMKKVKIVSPIIYLQHGTLGMKKIGYKGDSYNNNMFRFLYYNKNINKILEKENNFKPYQLKYSEYHPRYKELVLRNDKYNNNPKNQKSILWFLTWREYFGNNKETEQLLDDIKNVINSYKVKRFLEKEGYILKICLHQFFDKEKIDYITNKLVEDNIKIVTPNEVDVMDEIAKNDILITDYSSLAFDFTLLGKKVILYQPDIETYSKYREFYYPEEMRKYSVKTPSKLIEQLKNNNTTNQFFRDKLPEKIDYDYIRKGKHIKDLYNYFLNIQKNDITFIGYNFFGRGGTVSATIALAEGLLENECLVRFISLKKHVKKSSFPNGLNVKTFYYSNSKSRKNKLKNLLFKYRSKRAFKYDPNREYLVPYIDYALTKKLNKITSSNVVSTRESLHTYLKQAKSKIIKNKVYFFHTDCKVLEEQFTGLIDVLKNVRLEKVAFVTKNAKEQYEKQFNYNNFDNFEIIENSLDTTRMIEEKDIELPRNKKKHKAVYLLRISKDRIKDLENLIGFAEFLKEKNNNTITIDVYGTGDYVAEFERLLEERKVSNYITYKGVAKKVPETLKQYDCMIDFSLNHSFGMTYIEAILNGKMLFAMKNKGSEEVLKEIPYAYINSYDDLLNKINHLNNITIEELKNNYNIIENRYSRKQIAKKFINYLKQ